MLKHTSQVGELTEF